MKRSCDTCEWWDPCPNNEGWGVCHGGPPSALPGGTAVWPVTPATERCRCWDLAQKLWGDPDFITVRDVPGQVVGKVPVGWSEDQ